VTSPPRRQLPCRRCSRIVALSRSWNHRLSLTCADCLAERNLARLLGEQTVQASLPQAWSRDLFQGYAAFLQKRGYTPGGRWGLLRIAHVLCQRMGEELAAAEAINVAWLERGFATINPRPPVRASFLIFLREAGLLPPPDEDAGWLRAITAGVERVPAPFRCLVEQYAEFRVGVRQEQSRRNLSRVLALRTVAQDVWTLHRFARHLLRESLDVKSWALVTEGDVVRFLRSLRVNPNSRNVVRWTIHSFFQFCLRHHQVTHNPVPNERAREAQPSFRPLPPADQRRLLERWVRLDDPLESLVGCLGLLHGLSTGDLLRLQLADFDRRTGRLKARGRPVPVLLDELTRQAMEMYLSDRTEGFTPNGNPYLFANRTTRYNHRPVTRRYLSRRIRRAGVTQQQLRFTCLSTYAQEAGPRLLVDALGVSPTQADRYQRFLAYRAELAVSDLYQAFPDHRPTP
jgi:integrase